VAKAQVRRSEVGLEALEGAPAEVRDWQGNRGRVFVQGEIWNAHAAGPLALAPGQTVRVARAEGLTLLIEPETGSPE
jgi:membrane-bound serine protease (ClpP class)